MREEIDRKEFDTVLKSLVSLQFVVEDDRERLVPGDENDLSDREGQTQELRSQQGEPGYGSERISLLIWKGLK